MFFSEVFPYFGCAAKLILSLGAKFARPHLHNEYWHGEHNGRDINNTGTVYALIVGCVIEVYAEYRRKYTNISLSDAMS